jgi:hypothetical protein
VQSYGCRAHSLSNSSAGTLDSRGRCTYNETHQHCGADINRISNTNRERATDSDSDYPNPLGITADRFAANTGRISNLCANQSAGWIPAGRVHY